MKEKGVRKTKRTTNHFTPIVKLIFEGEVIEKEKSLLMRCASILRLGDSMDIEPDGIAAFVDEQGGIVQCYQLHREMHQLLRLRVPNPIRSRRYGRMLETAIRWLYGISCPMDL
jgi:hypothetical protein